MLKYLISTAVLVFWAFVLCAQTDEGVVNLPNDEEKEDEISYIHGDFQTEAQYYVPDKKLPNQQLPEQFGNNTYLNLLYDKGNLSAGLRFESYQPPLLGYDRRLKGTGLQNRYINYRWNNLSITVGHFYEQFGNGLIFRSYWEFGLGFDNAVDGVRLRYVNNGIQLKGFAGRQRLYNGFSDGILRGGDAEFNLNELISSMEQSAHKLTVGASVVSKYQRDDDPSLRLPENVASFAGRANYYYDAFNLSTEYAYKVNDPSFANNKIYKPGHAFLLTAGYSSSGFGVSAGVKRIDNMDFRSDRNQSFNDALINYLPPLTPQFTYRLATLYPYATQPTGEVGGQVDIFFNAPEGSLLGGEYGTNFQINYSRINNIQKTRIPDSVSLIGYESNFFEIGKDIFYQNISVDITKKINSQLKFTFSNIYIQADNDIIKVSTLPGVGMIYALVNVLDVTYKLRPKHTLRAELQHLASQQDNGSWAMALMEYQMGSNWFFALYNEYNYYNPSPNGKLNYPGGSFGYTKGTVRATLTAGRQRAGVFCVGGVCRLVPASSGVSLAVTTSF
jgi:hypothetical protein